MPVCSHILSTIDWEKEKCSFALMAKAFFVLFFFLSYMTSRFHFYPVVLSLKICWEVELCDPHAELAHQYQNKIKALAHL